MYKYIMKTFKNIPFNSIEDLSTIEINGSRHYQTPHGDFASVTTILDKMSDKTALIEWRKRVGDEAANAKTKRSTDRGSAVHAMCEDYIQAKPMLLNEKMPFLVDMFKQIQKVLDEKVDNIRGIEIALYSKQFKVAGRCDLIADYNDIPSIIDYKTSDKYKREDWIENYFLQCSLYSYMLWEMTGHLTKQIVLLIALEDSPHCQVIVKQPSAYIEKAIRMVKDYHRIHG